jgi:hypothetical protein
VIPSGRAFDEGNGDGMGDGVELAGVGVIDGVGDAMAPSAVAAAVGAGELVSVDGGDPGDVVAHPAVVSARRTLRPRRTLALQRQAFEPFNVAWNSTLQTAASGEAALQTISAYPDSPSQPLGAAVRQVPLKPW